MQIPESWNGIYWGYLRNIYRESKLQHRGDESKAMYDMIRVARMDNCPDDVLKGLVNDLREEGSLNAS
jgi:hypothetical protein